MKEIKYMTEQIAALRVYTGYVKQGYNTVKGGLNTIHDIKSGDINLHRAYHHSLIAINPAVRSYPKTKDIVRIQEQISKMVKTSKAFLNKTPGFSYDEKQYQNRVFDRLLADCKQTMRDFEAVLTEGELQMKHDERIRRIDGLHAKSLEQWQFSKQFCAEAISLAMARTQGQRDIDNSRKLHGIK
jgi:hypothetical protein